MSMIFNDLDFMEILIEKKNSLLIKASAEICKLIWFFILLLLVEYMPGRFRDNNLCKEALKLKTHKTDYIAS